jgi:hypothetical protein
MDNPKVEVGKTGKYGKGVFAKFAIRKGEVIAAFDGKIYGYYSRGWTTDVNNHAIQFEERKWRDSAGIARRLNHSCQPNCGIKGLFRIVAMRDIKKGEELTWDYEMTEDNPTWRMRCRCGSKNCRKVIGAHRNMPEVVRKKYKGYISEWLVEKYAKNK